MIPKRTMLEIRNYVDLRIPPGGFLRAVLENDLTDSVARGDDENLDALIEIVQYLYNHTPGICWGSPDKVQKWLGKK